MNRARTVLCLLAAFGALLPAARAGEPEPYPFPYQGEWKAGCLGDVPLDLARLVADSRPVWIGRVTAVEPVPAALPPGRQKFRVTFDPEQNFAPPGVETPLSLFLVLAADESPAPEERWLLFCAPGDEGLTVSYQARLTEDQARIYPGRPISRDVGLAAVEELVNRQLGLAPDATVLVRLAAEYRQRAEAGESAVRLSGCLYLAGALGGEEEQALLADVLAREVTNRHEFALFTYAARRLISRTGRAGVSAVLQSLAAGKTYRERACEVVAFFLAGSECREDPTPALRAFTEAQPRYLASAAAALARIGSPAAARALREWASDERFAFFWAADLTDSFPAGSGHPPRRLPAMLQVARALAALEDRQARDILITMTELGPVPFREEVARALVAILRPEDRSFLLNAWRQSRLEENLGRRGPPGTAPADIPYAGRNFRLLAPALAAIARPGDAELLAAVREQLQALPTPAPGDSWRVSEAAGWALNNLETLLNLPPDSRWTSDTVAGLPERRLYRELLDAEGEAAAVRLEAVLAEGLPLQATVAYDRLRRKLTALMAAADAGPEVVPALAAVLEPDWGRRLRQRCAAIPTPVEELPLARDLDAGRPADRQRAVNGLIATALVSLYRQDPARGKAVAATWTQPTAESWQRLVGQFVLFLDQPEATNRRRLVDLLARQQAAEETGLALFPEGRLPLIWHLLFLTPRATPGLEGLWPEVIRLAPGETPEWAAGPARVAAAALVPYLLELLAGDDLGPVSREGEDLPGRETAGPLVEAWGRARFLLRRIAGESYGFDPLGHDWSRRRAVARWRGWWEESELWRDPAAHPPGPYPETPEAVARAYAEEHRAGRLREELAYLSGNAYRHTAERCRDFETAGLYDVLCERVRARLADSEILLGETAATPGGSRRLTVSFRGGQAGGEVLLELVLGEDAGRWFIREIYSTVLLPPEAEGAPGTGTTAGPETEDETGE